MDPTHVISIDLGTSGVRVGLVDKSSAISHLQYAPFIVDCSGWSPLDDDESRFV